MKRKRRKEKRRGREKRQGYEYLIHRDKADDTVKYKDLLDKGIITQEEFDAKKKQLLGL